MTKYISNILSLFFFLSFYVLKMVVANKWLNGTIEGS